MPYPGGIVLMLNTLLWSPWIFSAVASVDVKKAVYVILAGIFTSVLMAWDDQKRSLSPMLRLGFQISL
ncbi:MAG: hypothetical protein WCK88_01995 [bacterium]